MASKEGPFHKIRSCEAKMLVREMLVRQMLVREMLVLAKPKEKRGGGFQFIL